MLLATDARRHHPIIHQRQNLATISVCLLKLKIKIKFCENGINKYSPRLIKYLGADEIAIIKGIQLIIGHWTKFSNSISGWTLKI